MKFRKVDLDDDLILSKLEANTDGLRRFFNFDKYFYEYGYVNHGEGLLSYMTGIGYKIDTEGKVVIIMYFVRPEGPISILRRIPDDLLELSHLKFLYLFCDINAIETIPSSIKSNDIFEVKILSIEPPSNLDPNSLNPHTFYPDWNLRCNIYDIYRHYRDGYITGYELIVIRKNIVKDFDLLKEVVKKY